MSTLAGSGGSSTSGDSNGTAAAAADVGEAAQVESKSDEAVHGEDFAAPAEAVPLSTIYAEAIEYRLEMLLKQHAGAAEPAVIPGSPHLLAPRRDAVALASALVRALPADVHSNPHIHAEIFDRLLLRHAAAETFTALGIEGDHAWRAAALVRITLAHNIGSLNTEAFWADNDVRWLLGVNDVEGTSYFNRELFCALLPWLELDPETSVLVGDEAATNGALLQRAEGAGYSVSRFLHRPGFVEASHGFIKPDQVLQAQS